MKMKIYNVHSKTDKSLLNQPLVAWSRKVLMTKLNRNNEQLEILCENP